MSGRNDIELSDQALATLMPMHLWFDPTGTVRRVGPTLLKLAGATDLAGYPLFDLVELRQPRHVTGVPALLAAQGQRLTMALKSAPHLPLRGVVVPLPANAGGLLNLSLGLSFAAAVAEKSLTLGDFSPCDQTVDLLYLREANAATARESRQLTDRLQAARQNAEEQAQTDALTGLRNRRAMDSALKDLVASPMARFGLMHLDLDFFKEVNDTLGHAAGDHVLSVVANVLRREMRREDIVARVGGDEFVLLFRDCEDPARLDAIANRIIARLEEPMTFQGQPCRISASVGSTLSSRYEVPDPDRMLNDADIALYASKHRGRAQHTHYSDALLATAPAAPRAN